MRTLIMLMLAMALVAPAAAQDGKSKVIACVAADSKVGIGNVRLVQAAKGDLLAFYSVGPAALVTVSKDRGATWADLAGKPGAWTVSDKALGGFDVCRNGTDGIILALATRYAIELKTLTRGDAGWSLSAAKALDRALRVKGPSVCVDAQGDVWVAYWFGEREGMQGVRVSRTSSGARFGERTGRYNIAWGFYSSVQKLAVQHGQPVIIYSGGTPWESLQLYWSDFNGTHWKLPRAGIGACLRSPGSFTLLTDDRDSLVLAWRNFPGRQHVRLRRRDVKGTWDKGARELDGNGSYTGPELVTDGRRIWVLYGRPRKGERVVAPVGEQGKPTVVKSDLAPFKLVSPGRIAPGARSVPVVWVPTLGRKVPARELCFATIDLRGK